MKTETTFKDLAKRLYDARKAAREAKLDFQAVAMLHGRCENLEDANKGPACYNTRLSDFCAACKAKQPFHTNYRAKTDAAAAALRAILRAAKSL